MPIAHSIGLLSSYFGPFGSAPALRRASTTNAHRRCSSRLAASTWQALPLQYSRTAFDNAVVLNSGGTSIRAFASAPADNNSLTTSRLFLRAMYMSGVKKKVCSRVLRPGLLGRPASTQAPRSISNLTQAVRPSSFASVGPSPRGSRLDGRVSILQATCNGVRPVVFQVDRDARIQLAPQYAHVAVISGSYNRWRRLREGGDSMLSGRRLLSAEWRGGRERRGVRFSLCECDKLSTLHACACANPSKTTRPERAKTKLVCRYASSMLFFRLTAAQRGHLSHMPL